MLGKPCARTNDDRAPFQHNGFVTKFCRSCQNGSFLVLATRVRAASPTLIHHIGMTTHHTFYARTPNLPKFHRVVNAANGCTGPALVLFKFEEATDWVPIPDWAWSPIPDAWVVDGFVHLRIDRRTRTLVPVHNPAITPADKCEDRVVDPSSTSSSFTQSQSAQSSFSQRAGDDVDELEDRSQIMHLSSVGDMLDAFDSAALGAADVPMSKPATDAPPSPPEQDEDLETAPLSAHPPARMPIADCPPGVLVIAMAVFGAMVLNVYSSSFESLYVGLLSSVAVVSVVIVHELKPTWSWDTQLTVIAVDTFVITCVCDPFKSAESIRRMWMTDAKALAINYFAWGGCHAAMSSNPVAVGAGAVLSCFGNAAVSCRNVGACATLFMTACTCSITFVVGCITTTVVKKYGLLERVQRHPWDAFLVLSILAIVLNTICAPVSPKIIRDLWHSRWLSVCAVTAVAGVSHRMNSHHPRAVACFYITAFAVNTAINCARMGIVELNVKVLVITCASFIGGYSIAGLHSASKVFTGYHILFTPFMFLLLLGSFTKGTATIVMIIAATIVLVPATYMRAARMFSSASQSEVRDTLKTEPLANDLAGRGADNEAGGKATSSPWSTVAFAVPVVIWATTLVATFLAPLTDQRFHVIALPCAWYIMIRTLPNRGLRICVAIYLVVVLITELGNHFRELPVLQGASMRRFVAHLFFHIPSLCVALWHVLFSFVDVSSSRARARATTKLSAGFLVGADLAMYAVGDVSAHAPCFPPGHRANCTDAVHGHTLYESLSFATLAFVCACASRRGCVLKDFVSVSVM